MKKYTREATTRSGRRTYRITYELIRGPEPKARKERKKAPAAKPRRSAGRKRRASRQQLTFF